MDLDYCFLRRVEQFMESVMSTLDDMQAAIDAQKTAVDKVGADVAALLAKIGTLTPEQQAQLDAEVTALKASTDELTTIDASANG